MELPGPRVKFAGCVWLARLVAKARLLQAGQLPPAYAERFCSGNGVDRQLLTFFQLSREDVLELAHLADAEAVQWFAKRTGATPEHIERWNQLAVNLGRPGFPMAERLPVALATTYAHLEAKEISTVFEALEADEGITT